MTDLEVLDIANGIAARLGIVISDSRTVLSNMHTKRRMMQTEITNGKYTIWIDRDYISYSDNDEIDINYVYLSRKHILEELPSILDRLKGIPSQGEYIRLKGIRKQMRLALLYMKENDLNDYIAPFYNVHGNSRRCYS